MRTLFVWLRTLSHLTLRQLWLRLLLDIRRKWRRFRRAGLPEGNSTVPSTLVLPHNGWRSDPFPEKGCFRIIGIEQDFSRGVDWGFLQHGALWQYALNGFDWAVFPEARSREAVAYMASFLEGVAGNPAGLDPWPISRRIQNWIRVLNRDSVPSVLRNRMAAAVAVQARYLSRTLEYHLRGNHLLENGLALLWAGYWLGDQRFLGDAMRVLSEQLPLQILEDGGHEERSPMYHCLLLDGLLDGLYMVRNNPEKGNRREMESVLLPAITAMLGWMRAILFSNGSIPQVNDSAAKAAPSPGDLDARARELDLSFSSSRLGESGYRKLASDDLELMVDVGPIGPEHNPGHGHCDTLSFILHARGTPLLVDTGTSSYDDLEIRLGERSTRAHNTVMVGLHEQSEIWGKFRVGRRARITDLQMEDHCVEAAHTGYDHLGVRHHRRLELKANELFIRDRVTGVRSQPCAAYFHFHPEIQVTVTPGSASWPGGRMTWRGGEGVAERGWVSDGFNRRLPAQVVRVCFPSGQDLETRIQVSG